MTADQHLIWLVIVQPYALKYLNFAEVAIIVIKLVIMISYFPLCTKRITEELCDKIDTFLIIFVLLIKISLVGLFLGRIAHKIRYRIKSERDRVPTAAAIRNINTSSSNELVTAIA
jgi:hypothetical protein